MPRTCRAAILGALFVAGAPGLNGIGEWHSWRSVRMRGFIGDEFFLSRRLCLEKMALCETYVPFVLRSSETKSTNLRFLEFLLYFRVHGLMILHS
jgi:hypothetical protein